MAKIILYIASSIDGLIARKNGSVDWLNNFPNPEKTDYGYNEFFSKTTSVIMGRKTYDEILGFDIDWPYSDCNTYVVSRKNDFKVNTPGTFVVNEINKDFVNDLKSECDKNIWLVGGGEIISEFLKIDAVDEIILTFMPIILSKGIELFPGESKEIKLELINSEVFKNGIVSLHYKLNNTNETKSK